MKLKITPKKTKEEPNNIKVEQHNFGDMTIAVKVVEPEIKKVR